MKKITFLLLFGMLSLLPTSAAYYVAGTMNGWQHQIMTQDASNSNLWNFTFTPSQTGTVEFKVTMGSWTGNTGVDEFNKNYIDPASPISLGGNDNVSFSISSTDAVTITFNASTKLISVAQNNSSTPVTPPVSTTQYYVAGTMNGRTHTLMTQDTQDASLWHYTISNASGAYEFKVTTGQWCSTCEFNKDYIDSASPIALGGNDNITFSVATQGTVIITFNASTKRISVAAASGTVTPSTPTVSTDLSACSGTLPVLVINTENNATITSKETYLVAAYYLDPMGTPGIDSIGSANAPKTMQIAGRGNYSWSGFDKKPYKLKLDTKEALCGMKADKKFAILANADDNKGFLRNTMGFYFSKQIGLAWTPEQYPIELVLNGDYKGLYFLTETIKINKNRVNIVEQADNQTNADSISGGWLVEIDNYDTDPHVSITEGDGSQIIFTYKSPEVLSSAQENFLRTEMTRINSLIFGDKNSDDLWNYVDIDALARYYIVQEILDDYESFHGSCYLYRDLGADQKWKFGPVWDFGSSFTGNKSQYIYQGRQWHQTWIGEICRFPAFMNKVKEIWQGFAGTQYDECYAYLNSFVSQISAAAATDASRWPSYGNTDMTNKGNSVSGILRQTKQWLSAQWGSGIVTPSTDNTYNVWFVDNGTPAWTNVYCYIWDKSNNNYEPLGSWSGTQMTSTVKDGQTCFTLSFTPSQTLSSNCGIIFNNGNGGSGNQTNDLDFVNNSIYNRDGQTGTIPTPTALDNTLNDDAAPIYYNLQGMRIERPMRGELYIEQRGSQVTKKLMY